MLVGANGFTEPAQEHTFEIGTEVSRIKYEEPGIMEEEGVMYGIIGSYAYNWKQAILKAEGRYSYGHVDYDGRLSDGTPYTVDSIEDYILEFRGLAGYNLPVSENIVLVPYIGVGYRYLNDALDKDAKGYERESNYFYSPIGIEAMTNFENGWSVGLILEYDYFWKGLQRSHLKDLDLNLNTIKNDQNYGYGYRGSIKLQRKSSKLDFVIEPFMRYWNINRSEDASITYAGVIWGHGWEPENKSTEYGIKIAAQF